MYDLTTGSLNYENNDHKNHATDHKDHAMDQWVIGTDHKDMLLTCYGHTFIWLQSTIDQ